MNSNRAPAGRQSAIGRTRHSAGATDFEAVRSHFGELPGGEQQILALSFYGGLSQHEIGARPGISQMHVSRLLARVLAYLRVRVTAGPCEAAAC